MLADQFDLQVMVGAVPSQIFRDVQQDSGWLATLADERQPFTVMVALPVRRALNCVGALCQRSNRPSRAASAHAASPMIAHFRPYIDL